MVNLKAKTLLKQLERLDVIIANKQIEQEQWRDIALSITAHSGGDRVQSSGSKQRMADALIECMAAEEAEQRIIIERRRVKDEITEIIEQLNATEYDLLHKVYIQHMTLYDAAFEKGKSYTWGTTVHGRALKNVQRLLDARDGYAPDNR